MKNTVENMSAFLEDLFRDSNTELAIFSEKTGETLKLEYDYFLKQYISEDYSISYDEDEEPVYSASFIYSADEIYSNLEVLEVKSIYGGFLMTFKAEG